MTALLVTVLIASLVGNLHCGGMCGPFVAFAVSGRLASPRGVYATHAAYHLGRLTTYSLLGAACGGVGQMIELGGAAIGMQRFAATLAGAMMVAIGVFACLRYFGVRLSQLPAPAFVQSVVAAGHRAAMNLAPIQRAALIGLLTTLLPCGWLYAFAITAAGTGSAASGAATMAAFWVGTLPVLVIVGAGAQRLLGSFGKHVQLVASLAIVVVGLATVSNRAALIDKSLMPSGMAVPKDTESAAKQAATINQHEMKCCEDE